MSSYNPIRLQGTGICLMNNRQWYTHYKSREGGTIGIRDIYSTDDIKKQFLVSYSDVEGNRLFTPFSSTREFWEYQRVFPIHTRSFFEIIISDMMQRPYFDVDIPFSSEHFEQHGDTISALKTAICKVFEKLGLPFSLKDICVYSSHGEKKKSYHIVIEGYCLNNHKETKEFYNMTMGLMNPVHIQYVDKAVYSSFQNFRLYGSQKHSSGRTKVLADRPNDSSYEEFLGSLVTNTGGCQLLKQFKVSIHSKPEEEFRKLTDRHLTRAVELMGEYLVQEKQPRDAITFDRRQGQLLLMVRNKPTYCNKCQRKHENENPFLTIRKSGEVMMFCRRGDKPTCIGEVFKRNTLTDVMGYICSVNDDKMKRNTYDIDQGKK